MTIFGQRVRQAMLAKGMRQTDLAKKTGIDKSLICNYISGKFKAKNDNVYLLSKALDVSEAWLMGMSDDMERHEYKRLIPPNITEEYITFPVIGEVAAGYDHIAMEEWTGETVDIPYKWLKGRSRRDFFVLRIVGDSMFPEFQNGDKVLVLKQSTLNYSGQVGVVLYDDEKATIKKVEFKTGEDWMRLVPVNPLYQPTVIENADLEKCRVLGLPKYLVREFNQ